MTNLVTYGALLALAACAAPATTSDPSTLATGLSGSILDERNDAIDFSSGAPIHTHRGAPIELGQACPAVYKYAYLESRTAPTFGAESTPNPLAWQVASSAASLYRVRLGNGRLALDWTPVEAPDVVRLDRDVVPQLGDYTGVMYLDVQSIDGSVDIACWDNHPLAAPLEVAAASHGELFGWTLAAHSPISTAIDNVGPGEGAGIYAQTFVQHVAEPIVLHFEHSRIAGSVISSVLTESIATGEANDVIACDSPSGCTAATPVAATTTSSIVPLRATFELRLIDDATGAAIWRGTDLIDTVIPARAPDETPHAYTAVIAMGASSLDPAPGTRSAEQTVVDMSGDATSFTGAITASSSSCIDTSGRMCVGEQTMVDIAALASASIAFDPFATMVETAVDANAAFEPIGSYVPSNYFVLNSAVWSAGSAAL